LGKLGSGKKQEFDEENLIDLVDMLNENDSKLMNTKHLKKSTISNKSAVSLFPSR